jgi:succinate dehydrogenase flavin-adding protein (antitoxin of CptAB toxin-antitoxin module)
MERGEFHEQQEGVNVKKAIVDVPSADYDWFKKLMDQNDWLFEWVNDGEELPDYVED